MTHHGDVVEVPEDVIAQLYEAAPDQFVAARDEAIASAKADGHDDLAKAIGRLRKPTNAAWLVNLLAIKRPELITELVELSEAMHDAQLQLSGSRLRKLAGDRRTLVAKLVSQAQALAKQAQPQLTGSKLALAEVEATLMAALTDEQLATQVRAGRLVRTTSYSGFGELPPGDGSSQPAPSGRASAADKARRELTAARAALATANQRVERAAAAERDATAEVEELDQALADLTRRRNHAEAERSRRELAHEQARQEMDAADERMAQAQAAVAENEN